jgi:XisI protein
MGEAGGGAIARGKYKELFDRQNFGGWYQNKREYLPFVHLDVKSDGKIWIQHDGTDLVLAQWLLDKGVPKKDIVLAFHAPASREMIPDFAVA